MSTNHAKGLKEVLPHYCGLGEPDAIDSSSDEQESSQSRLSANGPMVHSSPIATFRALVEAIQHLLNLTLYPSFLSKLFSP